MDYKKIIKHIILIGDYKDNRKVLKVIKTQKNEILFLIINIVIEDGYENYTVYFTAKVKEELITEDILNKYIFNKLKIKNENEIIDAIKNKCYLTTVYIIKSKIIHKAILLKKCNDGKSYYVKIKNKIIKVQRNKIFKHKRRAIKAIYKYYL